LDIIQSIEVLGNLGEFIGAILLLASLIYVGIQIKSNTVATTALVMQSEAHFTRQQYLTMAESDHSARIGIKLENQVPLDDEEKFRFFCFLQNQAIGINSYRSLYDLGFVSKDEFVRDISDLRQAYEGQLEAVGMIEGVRKTFEMHDELKRTSR